MTDAELPAPAGDPPQPAVPEAASQPSGESLFGPPIVSAPPEFHPEAAAWAAAITVALLCLLLNFASIPVLDRMFRSSPPGNAAAIFIAICLGVIAGEIAALSSVLVWTNGNFLLRLLGVWLSTVVAFCAWCLGPLTFQSPGGPFESDDFPMEFVIVGAALPLISLALQLPQWWMRIYLHWRIVRADRASEAPARESLSIRDILIGTAVVAVTLTVTRFSSRDMDPLFWTQYWLTWLIAVVALAAVGQLILMPFVFMILRCQSSLPPLAAMFAAPLLMPLFVGATVAWNRGPGPPAETYFTGYLMALTCLATASAPLWIARLAGYRLVIGGARVVSGIDKSRAG